MKHALRAGPTALFVLVVAAAFTPARTAPVPHFEKVGSESGPPSEVVTAVLQDHAGFVWIGSRNGLTLYDGQSFTSFVHDPADASSISDDAIRTIFEDSHSNLWIGTNSGGLNRFDRTTWTFERFRHDSADARSLSHDSVYAIAEEREGALWVGTQHGLNRFDPKSRTFTRFLADPATSGSLSHDYVASLLVDHAGRLWVGTVGGGLNRYDADARRFEVAGPAKFAYTLFEQPAGTLWIGTDDGLDRMDMATGRRARAGLAGSVVTCVAPGTNRGLWVGTFGDGLATLDATTATFHKFRREPGRRGALPADRVLSLMTDRAGVLWIGTWGGGLSRVTGSALLLAEGGDEVQRPDDLIDPDVTAIARANDGALWVGTRAGEILRKDPRTGAYRRYPQQARVSIFRILPRRDGTVWVGTNFGLLRLDSVSGHMVEYRPDVGDPASLGPGYVSALLEDNASALWVGTGEGGLQRVGADGRVTARFLHDPANAASLSDDYVTALHQDRAGTLWVGTRSGGVNAFDPERGRAVRFRADPSDPGGIGHDNVTDIAEDASGRLWISTAGGGFHRVEGNGLDGKTHFARFTVADGLVDNNVMAILEDDAGTLWLSTKRGLSRFAPEHGTFVNYFVADGLPSGEFEFGAAARTERSLYFGSVKWLVAIPASTPFLPPAASPTVVTSIRTQSGDRHRDAPARALERLEIPYGTWFSIELAVLDFNTEHNHAYAYRLGNARDAWVDLGTRREVTFTNLDPGTYAFSARGRGCQGVWSETSPVLHVRVVPPFWMTTWFRVLVAGALAGAALVAHRVRLSALERRNRALVELQEQRERAREELARAYERLQLLARRIEAAKEEERKRIARELHDDLGPALTAVVINLQLMGDGTTPAKNARRIEDSIDLVDRMVQQIRDLSLDLRPPLLDEMGLVTALTGYLETQAERTGLAIEVRQKGVVDGLPAEVEITAFRVAQEAVTNAIRHAKARRVLVVVESSDGGLTISVEDDGQGFDATSATEGAATGKSLGLLGMQERARMLGGRFDISSSPGGGTRVHIWLPVGAVA